MENKNCSFARAIWIVEGVENGYIETGFKKFYLDLEDYKKQLKEKKAVSTKMFKKKIKDSMAILFEKYQEEEDIKKLRGDNI